MLHSRTGSSVTRVLRLGNGRRLETGSRTLVMGIINTTPDSFYPGSRKTALSEAAASAISMEKDGADILDIGGESSRPGAEYVSEEEERSRVIPLIRAIREHSTVPISVDTRKARIASDALDAGADIINDITALRDDPELAALAAERDVPVVLMHMAGNPVTMQKSPGYRDAVAEIRSMLEERIAFAVGAGIREDAIIIDPGIGFGKRLSDNLDIIRDLPSFAALECPLLLGISRKAFIGTLTGRDVEDRLPGTLAAEIFAALNGADILRVHDVAATVDAVRVLYALRRNGTDVPGRPGE